MVGFCVVGASVLAGAIILRGSTSYVNRLELPAVCPEPTAYTSACVAVAVPLSTAPWVLPVADLHLAAWTTACRGNFK